MDKSYIEKACDRIPELEDYFNIDMSLESFQKMDLTAYFNIKKINHDDKESYDIIYSFETDYGQAQIVIYNFDSNNESISCNYILQYHVDYLSGSCIGY